MKLALFAAVLMLAAPSVTRADTSPEDYIKFLTQLEGNWIGSGFSSRGSFSVQIQAARRGTLNDWDVASSYSGAARRTSRQDFHVAGNFLTITDQDIFGGTAFVNFSSENSLQYTIQVSDGPNFYDYVYEYRISGDDLRGSLRVQRNVFTIYEETFSASKRH